MQLNYSHLGCKEESLREWKRMKDNWGKRKRLIKGGAYTEKRFVLFYKSLINHDSRLFVFRKVSYLIIYSKIWVTFKLELYKWSKEHRGQGLDGTIPTRMREKIIITSCRRKRKNQINIKERHSFTCQKIKTIQLVNNKKKQTATHGVHNKFQLIIIIDCHSSRAQY